jgi:hypothetical protein
VADEHRDDLAAAQMAEASAEAAVRALAEETVSYEERVFVYQASLMTAWGRPSQIPTEKVAMLPEPIREAISRAAEIEARIESAMPAARRRIRRRVVSALAPTRTCARVVAHARPRERQTRRSRRSSHGPPGRPPGDDDPDPVAPPEVVA